MNLMDSMEFKGKDYDEFVAVNKEIAQDTKFIVTRGDEMILLSICDIEDYESEGKQAFFVFAPEHIEDFLSGKLLNVGRVSLSEIGEDYLEELRKTTGLMAIINGEKYIVSDLAIATLCARAGVAGGTTFTRQNMIRNLHVADALSTRTEKIGVIYRTDNNIKKIFAVMGREFTPVEQTIVADIVNRVSDEEVLGSARVREWHIDQSYTSIMVEFPDAVKEFESAYGVSDIIPGIIVATSDIGASSVTVKGTYRKGVSYVISDEVRAKHTSGANAVAICEKVDNEIFDNVRKLPETLSSLISHYAINYDGIDLTKSRGQGANIREMSDLIKKIVKTNFKNVLPLKKQNELVEAMNAELNPYVPYTMYDVALMFMDMPERLHGVDRYLLDDVRKICGKIPYSLHKFNKATENDETIVLSA